jgi:hypothetical protein
MIRFLISLFFVACFVATAAAEEPASALKIWPDEGTAYVKGEIEEHNLACTRDGACYFRLHAEGKEVRIIYNPGNVPEPCVNPQNDYAQKMKEGEVVQAFGAYSKSVEGITISTCSAKDFFIRPEQSGYPLGRYTEHFFNEVSAAYAENARKQLEEARKSGRWDTFRDTKQGYEISYPALWQQPQSSVDAPFAVYYPDLNPAPLLEFGFISPQQAATMGIDYCAAHHEAGRCAELPAGKATALVDWGDESTKSATVKIPHRNGGFVTLTLKPASPEAKALLPPIIATFKLTGG